MATADLLFIGADPREFDGIVRCWESVGPADLPVHWSRAGVWKKRRVVAIANGAGPARAAAAARSVPFSKLCSVGFCGALDPALRVGDIVVGADGILPRAALPHTIGRVASIGRIAQTSAEKGALRASGAIAVEMESAGLNPAAFYCVKSVSDLADETFANDFNAVLLPDGRMSLPRLLFGACLRPWTRFPELLRLRERSRIASNTLGEFLDSCEF